MKSSTFWLFSLWTHFKGACILGGLHRCLALRHCQLFRVPSSCTLSLLSNLLLSERSTGHHRHVHTWSRQGSQSVPAKKQLVLTWTARRSNQLILKEINPEYSLEGLMLKLQYSSHLTRRANSLEKTLMLGKTEVQKRRRRQRMRCLGGITDSKDMSFCKLQEIVKEK